MGETRTRAQAIATFAEMINLDICYARNKSLWFDLKIMAKTFSTLASQVRELRGKTSPSAQTTLKLARTTVHAALFAENP